MLDNFFLLTLISRYSEQILKQGHILGAFHLTCFQYMYFNSAPWWTHEKIQRDAVSLLINGNAVSHWIFSQRHDTSLVYFPLRIFHFFYLLEFIVLQFLLWPLQIVTVWTVAVCIGKYYSAWSINASWLVYKITLFQPLWHFKKSWIFPSLCCCRSQYTINYPL